MKRMMLASIAVCLSLGTASALRVAMPMIPTSGKAATADAIVVGKVQSIEADTVKIEVAPNVKQEFKIAVVKIEKSLHGVKNLTHIKIAFPAPPSTNPGGEDVVPGRPGRPIRPFLPNVTLNGDEEGIFFLTPMAKNVAFYQIPMGSQPILSTAGNYKDEHALVEKTLKVVADPIKALKAEKAEDRLEAAQILSQKYRQRSFDARPVEEVELSKEESQLIVNAVLEADWNPGRPNSGPFTQPLQIASIFGLNPGVNGIPQMQIKQGDNYSTKFRDTLQTWYKANKDKVVLKKFVVKDEKK